MEIDEGSYQFASQFLHDQNRPRHERRTRWKVSGSNKDGTAIHVVDLFIDEQLVATHQIFDREDGRQPLWQEFIQEFVYDCMGVKAVSLLEENPPEANRDWPGDR